ncbi:MAG TPA: hypothetical protein VFM53_10495 [Anaeromyxobacteraceae bacterium]|nr:hypothetical protein [Anaeromyxobacteraceae bacterium]
MSDPGRPPRSDLARKIGVGLSAFAVFTAGWVAMRSDDWRVIVGVSALALVAGMIASGLSRRGR